jgi:uncharacterized membrane protein
MVVFHLARDLQMFGLAAPGLTQTGLWPAFARTVAGSFLALAGASLWLAHGDGIRWRLWLNRLLRIVAAAALVTIATWVAFPDSFVFWGILHCIAACSVIGLAFLRLPAAITLPVALAILLAPAALRGPAFDAPGLLWLGLSTDVPRALDYLPLLPWLAPFLAGLALAKIAGQAGWLARPAGQPGALALALGWPGRHSLAIYLLHQPVLVGLIWLVVSLRG